MANAVLWRPTFRKRLRIARGKCIMANEVLWRPDAPGSVLGQLEENVLLPKKFCGDSTFRERFRAVKGKYIRANEVL